ncbi:hypothetical protein JX266_013602 [Neoarthrinium moseri]|nr:hypothetical protein JX266_013602 [Neoarthrinium moseri]
MGTEVIHLPNPADSLVSALTFKDRLVTPASTPAAAQNETASNSRFVLNDPNFTDVQIYLRAATKLPKNNKDFEDEFPRAPFSVFLGEGDLWQTLRDCLSGDDGIYKHCETFQLGTVVKMKAFCGGLVNFSSEVEKVSADITKSLPPLVNKKKPFIDFEDAVIVEALAKIHAGLTVLKAKGDQSMAEATVLATELSNFKMITDNDKDKLDSIAPQVLPKLPDFDRLKASTNEKIQAADTKLKKCFEKQVELNRQRGFPQSGMIYSSVLGYTAYVSDDAMYEELKAADKEVSDLFHGIEDSAQAALKLKSKATVLTDHIKNVQLAIAAAAAALTEIAGVFSKFGSDIKAILTSLSTIDGALHQEFLPARIGAEKTLGDMAKAWHEIFLAAQFYQSQGLLLEREEPAKTPPPLFGGSADFEISSANFASEDVTTVARIIYQMSGNQIEIPGLIRELGDP